MKNRYLLITVILLAFFSGCSGSSSSSSDGSATIRFSLKDAPGISYKAVYVSVEKVEVQKGESDASGSWITVSSPKKTYNLLDLVNGAKEILGDYELEEGNYGQIRLHLANEPDSGTSILGEKHKYPNYVIDSENSIHMLKVPSGYQSGIKIVGGFSVKGVDFEIFLDFDAEKSVVKAGNSGQWLLKPVIDSIIVTESGTVKGAVLDEEGKALEGVVVSLQKPGSPYPEISSSTKTDEDGKYLIEAVSGSYVLAVSDSGYSPSCESVSVTNGTAITKNFSLSSSPGGEVSWNINIFGLSSEASVTLHIMSASPCAGTDYIEIKTLNIINGGDGDTELPVGSYIINYHIAETGASGTLGNLDITAGADLNFNIDI